MPHTAPDSLTGIGPDASENPILSLDFHIPFQRIDASHVVPGLRQLLQDVEAEVEALAADEHPPTWNSTIARFDALTRRVRRGTTPVQHLLGVRESPQLREAWKEILPEISIFWSRLYLHEGLWQTIQSYSETDEAGELDPLKARHLRKTVRDFQRAGADLAPKSRARLEAIDVELSRLEQEFSENVLDSTAAYSLHIEDEDRLDGIPADALGRFRRQAEARDLPGWLLTLDAPSFLAVMKNAHDRSLRRELHGSYLARGATDDFDNISLIPRIIQLRQEKAAVLGFDDFPDYRLEEQMAGSGERAREFLAEMVDRTRPYWRRDFDQLGEAAQSRDLGTVHPWDTGYLIEQTRKDRFELDEEELRPYFPLEGVLDGLFELTNRLFGLSIVEREIEEVWHEEVRFYEIHDGDGRHLGSFYTDFFPRPEKRQGAWMADFIYGNPLGSISGEGEEEGEEEGMAADTPDGGVKPGTPHLGNICANFPPPGDGTRPALLAHRDVETLFHEFGHLLHHCVSRVPIEGRGGINVAWDWVELPSQLMENWCWEREALDLFALHWETGEPLPSELHERMLNARRFMGGWTQMRQLSFGILDLGLHTDYEPESGTDPNEWVTNLLVDLAPNREFAAAHPLPAFLHLFSGGYAASYYAYLWSEVLEADLFSRFRDEGVFNPEVGLEFVDTILSQGDRDDPDVLYRTFMGRGPDPEALIRRNLGDLGEP